VTTLIEIERKGSPGVKEELPVEGLHRMASANGSNARGLADAALIRMGDYSLLTDAIHYVQEPAKDSSEYWQERVIAAIREMSEDRLRFAMSQGPEPQSSYCPSIERFPFDRSVLPNLESLLSSPRVEFRRAASHALRGFCDPSTARYLAKALYDNDHNVQYDAMMGLAALADFPANLSAPPETTFNQDPARYLNPWKAWWQSTGKARYESNG